MDADKFEYVGQVPHGSVLVDQTGNTVSNVVVKDRIMLSESGLVVVILTVDKKIWSVDDQSGYCDSWVYLHT